MTGNETQYPWEEWQLTAYLLNELEPELAAQIRDAAEHDPALSQQLVELFKTLSDVKLVLGADGTAPGDHAALAALQANFDQRKTSDLTSIPASEPATLAAHSARGWSIGRVAARWETWAAVAALVLVGFLLMREPEPQAELTALDPAYSTSSQPGSSLDSTVIREARDRSGESNLRDAVEVRNKTDFGREASDLQATQLTVEAKVQAESTFSVQAGPGSGAVAPEDAAASLGVPVADGLQLAQASPQQSSASGMAVDRLAAGGMAGGYDGGEGMASGISGGSGMGAPGPGGMPGAGGFGAIDGEGGVFKGYLGMVPGSERGEREAVELRAYREVRPSGDRFAGFADNEFLKVDAEPLSTFSIDVDTASYAKARQYLLEQNQLPPPAAVRIEEFINYFDYEYVGPKDDKPFAASLAVTDCPWQPKHQLVRIALQAKQVETAQRPKANLVFLLDVSGSMNEPNKLPLVKETMRLLTYQLTENDKVAMVVYAGAAGCVLESTYGHQQDQILAAIERLSAGGSTNGGQGIQLAYKIARENFISGGINRVILCTDGDFNVGVTDTNELVNIVKEQAQSNVFLTVLGYGIGNTNDAMMEQIADRGNGLYGFVDSRREASVKWSNNWPAT